MYGALIQAEREHEGLRGPEKIGQTRKLVQIFSIFRIFGGGALIFPSRHLFAGVLPGYIRAWGLPGQHNREEVARFIETYILLSYLGYTMKIDRLKKLRIFIEVILTRHVM